MTDLGFRPRTADPWWNESSFMTLRIPETGLMGVLYYYFRPNQNTAMGGPILFDASGSELSTCLHNGWDWNMPIPDGANMFDFALDNGFGSRTLKPEHSYAFTYDGPGCSFELTFTASVPPLVLTAAHRHDLSVYFAAGEDDRGPGHYDQVGLASGRIEVGGRTIEVSDAPGVRDRSWGPRRMLSNTPRPRGSYLYGQAGPDHAFQATVLSPHPTDQDPVVGVVDQVHSGAYIRDGIIGALVSGSRRVTGRGPDGHIREQVLDAVDEHGRTLHAEGTVVHGLRWPGIYGDIMAFWSYATWELDGHPEVPGEDQEFFTSRGFRRFLLGTGAAGSSDSGPCT
jgi:hypothetical protein